MTESAWTNYPIRTCRATTGCALCNERVAIGQRHYDGGVGKHAHIRCVLQLVTGKHPSDKPAPVSEAVDRGLFKGANGGRR